MGRSKRNNNKNKRLDPDYKEKAQQRLSVRAERKALKRENKRIAKQQNKKNVEKRYLIGVYGHLRRGGKHHINLTSDSKYIGSFYTEPIYNLYSFDNAGYVGLTTMGSTSVLIEVYEVPEKVLSDTDDYHDFDNNFDNMNMFNRETLKTPYGEILIYFYKTYVNSYSNPPIKNGDWLDYINTNIITNNVKKESNVTKEIEAVGNELEDEMNQHGPAKTISYKDAMGFNFYGYNECVD